MLIFFTTHIRKYCQYSLYAAERPSQFWKHFLGVRFDENIERKLLLSLHVINNFKFIGTIFYSDRRQSSAKKKKT